MPVKARHGGTSQAVSALLFWQSANPIEVSIMRAFALLLLAIVLFWAVDEVAFDGRNGAWIYQQAHHQGQKLKAEVKDRLNNDKT